LPLTSVGEENLLGRRGDRYRGESILHHEFGHSVMLAAIRADPTFERRLNTAYGAARAAGRFDDLMRLPTPVEYFAEGVQSYFNVNLESDRPNGIHNRIDTRRELRGYERRLFKLVAEVFRR
jgi:hypothetical protein